MTVSKNKPIQLGLCCLNTTLRHQKPPVFASRKMIIRTIKEQGIDVLKEKILQNLRDVLTMMGNLYYVIILIMPILINLIFKVLLKKKKPKI